MADQKQDWINDEEIADVQIKWPWSHFDGRDPMSGDGNYNFTIVLDPAQGEDLIKKGWNVKINDPYEEGDESEYTLKIKISYMFTPPKAFLIKHGRKFRCNERDLADIRRDSLQKMDIIITPHRWVNGNRTGVSAYIKEMYAQINESRFAAEYADYEEV